MRDYFLRRLILIPPTLFGVTILVFIITRFVPGGPLERAMMEAQMMDAQSGRSTSVSGQNQALSEDQIQQLKEYYGFDKPIHISYFHWVGKVLTGDLGDSYRYNEPVWNIIQSRFPISIFYGVITLILTYMICIPLGIVKAIKHRTVLDTSTSIVIFMGYAVPGYVLGALLLLFFSARLEWFPMGGFTSLYFDELGIWEKVKDLIHHAILPLCCYMIGSFAITTMLMKNHLMDNLSADYMRTAVAKGVTFERAVFKHALRNSLIPIATTFGQNITLLVSGSFLIETIFDINGFGLLGLTAIFDRDYPVVMGVVFV
jgi:microcin C transport system permease protein